MKSIVAQIAILLAVSQVSAAAKPDNKSKLRGRSLEAECIGVPNGSWKSSPGCIGAIWCYNDGPFHLYPCEEGQRYDEEKGGCRPRELVSCTRPWASLGIASDAPEEEDEEDDKEERRCNTAEEKAAYKMCKKTNCTQGDVECKETCRNDNCNWDN